MPVSQKEYGEMVKKASPNSKSCIDIPCAFVIGGLICPAHRSGRLREDRKTRRSGNSGARNRLCQRRCLPCGGIQVRGIYPWSGRKDIHYRRPCYPLRHSSLSAVRAYLLFLIKISHTMETPTTETLSGLPFFMAASASFAMRLGSLMGSARISSNSP